MITRPTPAELIAVVRVHLKETLAPTLSSPHAHAALSMADSVLAHVQAMSDSELSWIREEIDAVDALAETLVNLGADVDGRLDRELAATRAGQSDGWDMPSARTDYRRSSALLSCCVEVAAVAHASAAQAAVDAALEQRVAREAEIKGALVYAARVEREEPHDSPTG
jgi:hypothetical protein